jgi:hypothetical protein
MALELNGTTGVQGNSGAFVAGTAVASTSGTSIDFTSIPSWVKRITVMLNGVSTNGTSNPMIQLGSGSAQTTGYLGSCNLVQNASATIATAFTTGVGLAGSTSAASTIYGHAVFTLITGNLWAGTVNISLSNAPATAQGGGNVTLSGTLDRVRITTVNGTDAFDAGTINISYE